MLRSYIWLVLCVTVWGSNFVFGAILVEQFPPMLLAMARLSVTSTFYVLFAWTTGRIVRPTLRDWKLVAPISVLTLINQASFYQGLQQVDPTVSALITALSPIAVSLLAALFLRERMTLRMAIGSLVAVTGVFFVVGSGGQGFTLSVGELWIGVAMLSFSVSMILTRKLTEFRDPFFATAYGTVIGASMLLPVSLSQESIFDMSNEVWAWALLIACALVMQVVCGLLWNREMQRVGAGKAAIFLNLQPFVAMTLGYLILNKPVTGTQIIGSILIIGGVLLATAQAIRAMKVAEKSGLAELAAGASGGTARAAPPAVAVAAQASAEPAGNKGSP